MEIYYNRKLFSYSIGREGGGGGEGAAGFSTGSKDEHSENKCYKFLRKPLVFIVILAIA